VAGKKLYSFWVVWPHEKKGEKEKDKEKDKGNESDDDNLNEDNNPTHQQAPTSQQSQPHQHSKVKDLKQIVEQETMVHKRQKEIVNEQLELHHAHDNNVSIGAKVNYPPIPLILFSKYLHRWLRWRWVAWWLAL